MTANLHSSELCFSNTPHYKSKRKWVKTVVKHQFMDLASMETKSEWSEAKTVLRALGRFPAASVCIYLIAINLSCPRHAHHFYSFLLWTSALSPSRKKQNEYALCGCRAVICQIPFQRIPFRHIKSCVCCHSIITLCTLIFTYTSSVQEFSLKAFTSSSVRDELRFATDEMKCGMGQKPLSY